MSTPINSMITDSEREQVAEILSRRANDIATFPGDSGLGGMDKIPGSVEMALTREINRLRRLAEKIRPITHLEPPDEF